MNGGNIIGNKKEKKKIVIPELCIETYFQFLSLVFFIMGFMMLWVCMSRRIHPMSTEVLSSPVHYLVLGIVCMIVFLVKKYESTKK